MIYGLLKIPSRNIARKTLTYINHASLQKQGGNPFVRCVFSLYSLYGCLVCDSLFGKAPFAERRLGRDFQCLIHKISPHTPYRYAKRATPIRIAHNKKGGVISITLLHYLLLNSVLSVFQILPQLHLRSFVAL